MSEPKNSSAWGWRFWLQMALTAVIVRLFGILGGAVFFGLWWLIQWLIKDKVSSSVPPAFSHSSQDNGSSSLLGSSPSPTVVQPLAKRNDSDFQPVQVTREINSLEIPISVPTPTHVCFDEPVSEEDHWATAMVELETVQRRPGLWAKAFAESDGDETKAKVAYLKSRVQQLVDVDKVNETQRAADRQEVEAKAKAMAMELLKAKATAVELLKNVGILMEQFELTGELSIEELKLLVSNASVNRRIIDTTDRSRGNTLLHVCAKSSMVEEVHSLMRAGANPQLSNGNGQRPESMTKNTLIVKLLQGLDISAEQLRELLGSANVIYKCPNNNCGTMLPIDSLECPKCKAVFGKGSTWKLIPLESENL
jgi:hypothetical protein